jgi:Ternary complex associated domain 9
MPPSNSNFLRGITNPEVRSFEQALSTVRERQRGQSEADALDTISQALLILNESDQLGISERYRRARILLTSLWLPRSILPALSVVARKLKPELKNAVVSSLPPPLRRAVFSDAAAAATPPAPVADKAVQETAPMAQDAAAAVQATSDIPRFRTVLLLGTAQEHEHNQRLLQQSGFDSYRVDDPGQVLQFFDNSVCGVVVGRSWWVNLVPDDHRVALEQLFAYSTFTWVRMDTTGFDPTGQESVQDIHRTSRLSLTLQVVPTTDCRLNDYDLQNFHEASCLIETSLTARLTLGDVRANEEVLLLAATAKCVQARHIFNGFHLEKVPVAPVAGGQSSARIFRIEPNDGGVPLIAKLDDIVSLRDEMERFERFIHPWDALLSPCLHFHAGVGVIVFTLVHQAGSSDIPAPTLEDRLRAAMLAELGPPSDLAPREENLGLAMDRAIDRLADLNSRPCQPGTLPSRQWLDVGGLEAMISRGTTWHFNGDVLGFRKRASEQVQRFATRATVHGDVHLRNVLLRDDREPHFIDYALSGPGHPCFDLVRLESALFFQCFRMTDIEHRVAALARLLAEERVTEADVHNQFPELCSCLGNRLAIRASIRCQNACLKLLRQLNGSAIDYIAVKYIVACQSLTLPQLQSGVVRGILTGLHAVLARHLN